MNLEPELIHNEQDNSLVVGILGTSAAIAATHPCRVTIDTANHTFSGINTSTKEQLFSFDTTPPQIHAAITKATQNRSRPKVSIWEANELGLHFFEKIEFVFQ